MTRPPVSPDEGGEAPCFAHLFDEPPTVADAIVIADTDTADTDTADTDTPDTDRADDDRADDDEATTLGDDDDEDERPAPGRRGRPPPGG